MRTFGALIFATLLGYSLPAAAAELVMMEQEGCSWCEAWHQEIGPVYPKTDEAKIAPLRLIDINEPIPDDLSEIRIERFTPSFVLVDDGTEIGRIRGYPGDEFFWFLLGGLLDKLDQRSKEKISKPM